MFKIVINDVEAMDGAKIVVEFKYTANYPNEVLEFSVVPTMQLTNDQKDRVKDAMARAAQEELGAVMVFSMISAAKEYLEEMFGAPAESENKVAVVQETVPQEQRGTPVTKENFNEWNVKFMAELRASGAYVDPVRAEFIALPPRCPRHPACRPSACDCVFSHWTCCNSAL